MLNAIEHLLCSKLCWQNWLVSIKDIESVSISEAPLYRLCLFMPPSHFDKSPVDKLINSMVTIENSSNDIIVYNQQLHVTDLYVK